MKVHICDGDIHLHDTHTRLPFKYGIAIMTSAPHLLLRLHVEVDGKRSTGIAADGLAPKWFTKDPNRPIAEEVEEMLRVIEQALQLAVGVRADTPFDAWLQVYHAQSAWGKEEKLPPLLTQFGTSLVERALIEAVCRAAGRPFHELLRANVFGLRVCAVHPTVPEYPITCWGLRDPPLEQLVIRHTIGLLDPLTEEDVSDGERLHDGLPQSLEACVGTYGLRHFKIKVSGRGDADVDRLRRIAAVLRQHAPADFAFSLDGNEQFYHLDDFRSYWDTLHRCEPLKQLFDDHCLFVEQPLHRSVALDPGRAAFYEWKESPPVIIDESDGELDSLPRALALGYRGVSHKNCKGVFKSVLSNALLQHQRQISEGRYIVSGEDLCSIGPVAMVQDLTACASLTIGSVERNGHHYFAGLSMWPADVQEQVLAQHGDLYRRSRDGWPTVRIDNGCVTLRSLLRAPFGVGFEMPVERFLTPDAWRRAHPL